MMMAIAPLLKQLMVEGIMNVPVPRLPRISFIGLAFIWLGAVLSIMAIAMLFFAEYAYLATIYSVPMAALGVACTIMAAGLICISTGMMAMNNRRTRAKRMDLASPPPDIAKTMTALIDSIAEELEDPIRDNPKTAVMMASLAGFLAGDHSRHN